MRERFSDFADFKAGYSGSLFAQGTELEAISRGNDNVDSTRVAQFFGSLFSRPVTCIRTRRIRFVYSMML